MNTHQEDQSSMNPNLQIQWALSAVICLMLGTPHLVVLGIKLSQPWTPVVAVLSAQHLFFAVLGIAGCVIAFNHILSCEETEGSGDTALPSPMSRRGFLAITTVLLCAVVTLNV